ncbi:MAG: UvrD-helicase domain-containing protein [Acidobacteria bacterium]|nr:UvrD-helicase domain-containing protein [Acidobacteriota bacterium]
MDFLSQLNPDQKAAVEYTRGPMLVVAGAGSGKTRVITYKVAHLLARDLYPPDRILAVTFTNKAATEMKDRLAALISHQGRGPLVCTFHSFCARFLRQEIGRLGYPADYTIYDADDQKRLIKNICQQLKIDEKLFATDYIKFRISQAKIQAISPTEYLSANHYPGMEDIQRAYSAYEQSMKRSNALDFDDLILKTNQILQQFPDVRRRLNQRYGYILVDEFQDTNPPQYRLVRHLTDHHQNICVVGDEDQAIYGFRGAILSNILYFEKDYPGCKVFKLEQNYRSTRLILRAASMLASHNALRREKKLWTQNEEGIPIAFFQAQDPAEEAGWVARSIQDLLLAEFDATIGVLYRTNFQSRRLEDSLRSSSIRYKLMGGLSFYNRKEIKDMVSYLKLLINPDDDMSFLRCLNMPPRGIGDKTVRYLINRGSALNTSLWRALQQELDGQTLNVRARTSLAAFRELLAGLGEAVPTEPLDVLVRQVFEKSGYAQYLKTQKDPDWESRTDNIHEFITFAGEHSQKGGTLSTLLEHVSLHTSSDEDLGGVRVALMTLHSAKGLEFDVVFVVGLEEGLLPHSRSQESSEALEEERRLCYVGMTRARKRLALSHSRHRHRFNQERSEQVKPSRFLTEIPEECLQRLQPWERLSFTRSRTGQGTPPIKLRESGYTTFDTPEEITAFFAGKSKSSPVPQEKSSRIVTRIAAPDAGPSAAPPLSKPSPAPPAPSAGRANSLRSGDRVRHHTFGEGTVVRIENSKLGRKVKIAFDRRGLKILIEHLAKLEKLTN